MAGRGCVDTSAAAHVGRLALVSAWLEKERLDPSAVDEALIGEIVDATSGAKTTTNYAEETAFWEEATKIMEEDY